MLTRPKNSPSLSNIAENMVTIESRAHSKGWTDTSVGTNRNARRLSRHRSMSGTNRLNH